MTTTIGYARVSTFEQLVDLQRDALNAAGCNRIFTDTASGGRSDRTGLQQALDYVREGDILVVWRLDRLGRSLKYLIEIITLLSERGIGFRSLTEQIDITTSGGKLIFHVFGALAEFERDVIRERTQTGLAAARARGRMGGRPKKLGGAAKIAMAQALYDDQSHSVADICKTLSDYRYETVQEAGCPSRYCGSLSTTCGMLPTLLGFENAAALTGEEPGGNAGVTGPACNRCGHGDRRIT